MKDNSLVFIIILNWNGIKDTLECLASVKGIGYQNFRIIVVDNGSTDGSPDAIRRCHSDISLLETGRNLGYAEGNNVGIRHALKHGADFILLLNNDTVVDPDFLTKLMEATEQYPEFVVLGPKIYYYHEPDRIWCAGNKWTGWKTGFKQVGDGDIDGPGYNEITETDYIIGCALFAKREVFERIGLLDPRFFLTYEETDWCYRARKAGYRCLVVPGAKIWHKVATSMGGAGSPLQEYFYTRNLLLWAERHLPGTEYWPLLREIARFGLGLNLKRDEAGSLAKRVYWNARSSWARIRGHSGVVRGRARYLAVRDYILRRFGDCPAEVRSLPVAANAEAHDIVR